jgi:PAS domain S-box-containing protein
MRRKAWLLLMPFYLAVCAVLFVIFYNAAKQNAVQELNQEQSLHARQAAQGIEEYFVGWVGLLNSLARMEVIADLNEDGRKYMGFFQESHRDQIRAITRVSAEGRILHTVPLNPQVVGSDISYQKHVQEIMRDHRPVVSDVFRAVQGYDAVALHVPVFKGGVYAGSIAIVVNFQTLAQRYFAVIRIGRSGHAWVVSRDGTTLYSPEPGQTGRSVFENFRNAPTFKGVAEEMLRGNRGEASFTEHESAAATGRGVKKYAIYMPIRLGSTFWSILVASSGDEMFSSLRTFRNRLALIMALLVAGGACFTFIGAKAWLIIREEEKRRRVEEALRESEERFRELADALPQTVFEADVAGRITYANRAGLEAFGYSAGELAGGAHLMDLIAAPERDRVRANLARRMRGELEPQEYLALRRDGSTFPIVAHTAPVLRDGVARGLRGILFDITERKKAEAALQVSEERFRTIIERANEGILVAESSSRELRYANPEICRMLGYTPEELHLLGLEGIHPPGVLPGVIDAFGRMARGEMTDAQFPCLRKDGSVFQANIRGTHLVFDGRECLVGFFTDISDRRLLEEERLKSAKLEAIGILAGGVAHDFNNLLQGIFGSIALAKRDFLPGQPTYAMLEQAEKALRQSVGLTTQLLTFSKGGKPLKRPMPLRPVIESAAGFALSGSTTSCRLEIDADLRLVDADEGQVAQVIQNVVLNAAQAMPRGGTVAIAARNVHAPGADLQAQLEEGDFVEVSIRDEGEGIPPEHLPRIFDPYFTTKTTGSGLGLATSYSIVRNHGGAIAVHSEPGRGSTFFIYLPAAQPEVVQDAAPPGPPRVMRRARILLMDDEEMVREVTGEMLRLLGHDVRTATNGEEALDLFLRARESGSPFDVVLLDLTIRGGMGGEEALGALLAIDAGVRAVVVSGYADSSIVAEYRTRGFKGCLRKPYRLEDLDATIASLLA